MIKLACGDLVDLHGSEREEEPCEGKSVRVNRAYQVWSLYDKVKGKPDQGKVWRISQFLGCQRPDKEAETIKVSKDLLDPNILVLDNLGLGFQDKKGCWPAALQEGGKPGKIILKTSLAPGSGELWKELLDRFADRLTVILSIEALRARGAKISQAMSWDLTIEETVREMEHGLSSRDLARCDRVIIHFGCAGAASFSRRDPNFKNRDSVGKQLETAALERILYQPNELEGNWKANHPGQTFGSSSILTAVAVRHEVNPDDFPLLVGLSRGLTAIRANHEIGRGQEEQFCSMVSEGEMKKIFHPNMEEKKERERALVFSTAFPHVLLDSEVLKNQPTDHSDLLRDLTGAGIEYVMAKAIEVVIRGSKDALKDAPKACYGKYLTVDREEIERINAVRNLIRSYQTNDNRQPLSLAVFGPPGSGKSFAIKELAAEMFGSSAANLEFNLSQFQNEDELHTAFHRVRDASVRGQIPLVFWDEFDTDGLKWLKYFLAPMQDAKFMVKGNEHPFGKAIFIFAGGTCRNFEAFDRSSDKDPFFRNMKGPDFISRLKGFVNIKGPNPVEVLSPKEKGVNEPSQDIAYLIRRALMLRAALEIHHKGLIDPKTKFAAASAGVIGGFLRVKEYLHGARSLNAIVSMSSPSDGRSFGPTNLPSADLLKLHVTGDFLDHVNQGELEMGLIESLAEACHEAWKKQKEKDGWTYGDPRNDEKKKHPLLRPYEQLKEIDKEGNRMTARLTQAKLHEVGCRIERKELFKKEGSVITEFPEDIRKRLMRIEHDIWLRLHLLQGYQWAPETRENMRLHRDISPFEAVPPDDQTLDRVIIDTIPEILDKNGYCIVVE
jgi:DNA polymerase III delta prime subunit